ncbi:hypothetical protein [Streptomyces sp. NBC_00893]|uniref:hypothetical protein n=1 Tax=Streptomyces sp. NBC_00893 TaxID=2975862 RepID=UPI002257ED93|nr:hypothetical protein [Streptomyces sp. NBC_00893]MCX4849665.1 hypothetical protein [Streptomyces sp. NBC_00893]
MSENGSAPRGSGTEVPSVESQLPTTLHVAGLALSRMASPPSSACWTGYFAESAGADQVAMSLVIEPAAPPDESTLRLAHDVVSRFGVFVDQALEYCRTRLRERRFELTTDELNWLDLPELPIAAPEATVWADQTWAIRFTQSRLRLADPYGILVTFNRTQPVDLQGLTDEQ